MPERFARQYFMLDFFDFLEYATSNPPNLFSINQISSPQNYYYQGFPDSHDKSHFENRYGNFSIEAACLSRSGSHLWITVHFKTQAKTEVSTDASTVDLLRGSQFFDEFLSLHLMQTSREELQRDLEEEFGENFREKISTFTSLMNIDPEGLMEMSLSLIHI